MAVWQGRSPWHCASRKTHVWHLRCCQSLVQRSRRLLRCPVDGEFPIVSAKKTTRTRTAVIRPSPNPYPRQVSLRDEHTVAFSRSTPREVRACPGADVAHASRRDRRLIQPATVRPPAIRTDTRPCTVRVRFRRAALQPHVRAMTVIVPLEIKELRLQISGCPEERAVQTFAPKGSNQPFDEWMRERHVGHCLDRLHVEYPQIRLPLVEPLQRVMVRAEVCRRGAAARRSIEHPAQPHAINDAAVHAKAHDAPRKLVHHDETQCVRWTADSHRNRSRLHRLSFA